MEIILTKKIVAKNHRVKYKITKRNKKKTNK